MKITATDIYNEIAATTGGKESTVEFFTKWAKVAGCSPAKLFIQRKRMQYDCTDGVLLKAAKMIGLQA